jgi:hypothetical protein
VTQKIKNWYVCWPLFTFFFFVFCRCADVGRDASNVPSARSVCLFASHVLLLRLHANAFCHLHCQ